MSNMQAMTNPSTVPIEAVILAAGMTCYADECDVVVMKRPPRVIAYPEPAVEITPPLAGD
jgi:hypothetical protein